jgi:hypothetical protein
MITISDDYEEIGHIRESVLKRWGLNATKAEVVAALRSLVETGMAKAYFLHTRDPQVIEGMPEDVDVHYFYLTPAGIDAVDALPAEWFPP